MKAANIREKFLSFFESKQHSRQHSSSLIPAGDNTLLFTNAGMNQFKNYFLGIEHPKFKRATTSQKCVRAGGKHNDLENVGYTVRHHTFFEMLGNFSFGDYFKEDAIKFAWEFLTSIDYLNIPAEKLYVTVYATDDEAYDIWHKTIGLSIDKIIRIGDNKGAPYASDNFWAMGDTGPCGPCTEIFYDRGSQVFGGLPGTADEDGERYTEIWNIVFMQFNKTINGEMVALSAPCVDTGMGLERIAAVLQGVDSNYAIDIFQNILKKIANILNTDFNLDNASLKVIADHIRSISFLIADGVMPSNEGRGYVLRRIIRRAARHGNKLGASKPFMYKLVQTLVLEMGAAYPELVNKQALIENTLKAEEEQFIRTLETGLRVLEQDLKNPQNIHNGIINGSIIFKLYDTYGFPVDLTADIAREKNLSINEAEFDIEMEKQRNRARESSKFAHNYDTSILNTKNTKFLGYESLQTNSTITDILDITGTKKIKELQNGQEGIIVLDVTGFYAESGGQIGDVGCIKTDNDAVFEIYNTQKVNNIYMHKGVVKSGSFIADLRVHALVDDARRINIARNHSATHLLHAALRAILGNDVTQKGSLVDNERLRFDFNHNEPVTYEQLIAIEDLVNQEILNNSKVLISTMSIEEARAIGAMALFSEKYGDLVRVVKMGNNNFSVELCGGTHVKRTGEIGFLKIITETGIASGVRRIEAVSGVNAIKFVHNLQNTINSTALHLKTNPEYVVEKLNVLLEKIKTLELDLAETQSKTITKLTDDILQHSVTLNGITVILQKVADADNKQLLSIQDKIKEHRTNCVLFLIGIQNNRLFMVAGVSRSVTDKIQAVNIIKEANSILKGKGGGKADTAQGSSNNLQDIDITIDHIEMFLKKLL